MATRRIPGAAVDAASYAARNDGDLAGLPEQSAALLLRLGLAEGHRRRLSYLGNASHFSYNRLRESRRLTAEGFEAAGMPHREGGVRLVFRREDHHPGRSVALMCREGRLRVVMAELEPARPEPRPWTTLGFGKPLEVEFEDFDDLPAAVDALEAAFARARSLSGAEGFLLDPAHLAWDGPVLSLEEPDGDGAYPAVPAEEVLARLREASPSPARAPA